VRPWRLVIFYLKCAIYKSTYLLTYLLTYHFRGQKVKGQDHQAALLTAVLARQAAAAVGVGRCWPWETAATLSSARSLEKLRRPRGGEGRWHIVAAARLQLVYSSCAKENWAKKLIFYRASVWRSLQCFSIPILSVHPSVECWHCIEHIVQGWPKKSAQLRIPSYSVMLFIN